tara:strand:- start:13276 stop:14931 length:1656 start_codon:yes stop_codon:yes gene_type:complete
MIIKIIEELLIGAADSAQKTGKLPRFTLPELAIEWPQNLEHGDYASSLPLKMARAAGLDPYQIAEILREEIETAEEIESVSVAPPGFLNFKMDSSWMRSQIQEILSKGETFGNSDIGLGQTVQVEFVSVNPTGPIHVGHGRGAILGSTLANLLKATGHNVQKEYYINDAGNQINNFARSLWVRYLQSLGLEAEMPEEGYLGQYMINLGEEIANKYGEKFIKDEPTNLEHIAEIGMEEMLYNIRNDLSEVNVQFDKWFSEKSLFESKTYDKAIELLKQNGHTAEREEALWFTGSLLGDNRDSVLVRRTGAPTYFASDIAYHYDKFIKREFDRVINIWGADHQGHVPRMNAVMEALGVDENKLEFILVQLVTLKKGGSTLRVSKRTGDILTLSEVIEEVGADSCRYFFLSRSPDSQMDFDMDLAKKEAPENPVYYIQYAYARIASILRDIPSSLSGTDQSYGKLLVEPEEENLIRQMVRFPEVIESSAKTLEPHHLTHYTLSLASDFHEFYTKHRVLGIEDNLSLARIDLIKATQTVLRNALNLMGMTVPEKM